MDEQLRQLERQALNDPDAKEKLARMRQRAATASAGSVLLQFTCSNGVPSSGTRYLQSASGISPNLCSARVPRDAVLRSVVVQIDQKDWKNYRAELTVSGKTVARWVILGGWDTVCAPTISEFIPAMSELSVRVVKLGESEGASIFQQVTVMVEMEYL